MSDHRSVSVQDRRVAPTDPGHRSSRRASSPPPPPDDPPRGRRSGGSGGGKMRVFAWISIVLTALLVAGSLTGYALVRNTLGAINKKGFKEDLINNVPKNATGALNVLIVGSDTREGDNAKYGRDASKDVGFGKRTDTILLMHISPNRDNVQVLSFPRDSMVNIPRCKDPKTKTIMNGRLDMINSAYNSGGISCTIETIQTLTQIHIDHYVEVDFSGFKSIINAIGGVSMCFKQPIDDKNSKLHITAGNHKLTGEQALAFMRLRHYGDGSDLSRITRQQQLLSKMVQQVTKDGLLGNPTKLLDIVSKVATSVTMDPDLGDDPQKLISIAGSAKSLSASGVKFIKIPVTAYPADPNRVIWLQPVANELFQQISQDIEVAQPTPTATSKVTIKPEQVRIQVLNGSGKVGEGQRVADLLTKHGFTVESVGNAADAGGAKVATTKVLYSQKSAGDADFASVAAAKLSGTVTASAKKVKPTESHDYVPTAGVTPPEGTKPATSGPIVQVVIGADFRGVRVPTVVSKTVQNNTVTADTKNICA
ncbi:LCP family protein [Nonomuraea sp. NPDC050556]|uniref:LCP family protein n=1 Tax=Nonomuraea sp. NPDC050556 TaxID=3364369 RepID=UPI0037879549